MHLPRPALYLVLALVSSWSLGSCASHRTIAPASTIGAGVPTDISRDTPQQTPQSSADDETVFDRTPMAGLASLRGIIETAETVLLGELYLAAAVPTNQPEVDILELDTERAPRATIDRVTGKFVFADVTPGKYGIIVWEPMSSAAVADPNTGETLLVVLEPDDVVDLGALHFP